MNTNAVLCTVVLVVSPGFRKIYELRGVEYPGAAQSEKIMVDFGQNWPKDVPAQATTFYVDENSCLYYNLKTYDGK